MMVARFVVERLCSFQTLAGFIYMSCNAVDRPRNSKQLSPMYLQISLPNLWTVNISFVDSIPRLKFGRTQ